MLLPKLAGTKCSQKNVFVIILNISKLIALIQRNSSRLIQFKKASRREIIGILGIIKLIEKKLIGNLFIKHSKFPRLV